MVTKPAPAKPARARSKAAARKPTAGKARKR
jgi:hypothetical protein